MQSIHFLHPRFLASLVILIPTVYAALRLGFALRVKARAAFGEKRLVDRVSPPLSHRAERLTRALWLAAIALAVVALAGPSTPDMPTRVKAGTLQVVIVTDVSKSMAAEDYRADMPAQNGVPAEQVLGPYGMRLDMVKQTVENQIMPAIVGNELGVSTFEGDGFDQADLTDDFESLRWVIDNWVKIDNAPGGGSDYAEGMKTALTMFAASEQNQKNKTGSVRPTEKVIVLFSDGGFTGDQANLAQVIEQLRQQNVRVIVVGVGADKATPIPTYDPKTLQLTGYYQLNGQVATTSIDEPALTRLAAQMNGTYVRLIPGQKLPVPWATDFAGSKTEQHEHDLYQFPLGLAVLALAVLFFSGALRRDQRLLRSR